MFDFDNNDNLYFLYLNVTIIYGYIYTNLYHRRLWFLPKYIIIFLLISQLSFFGLITLYVNMNYTFLKYGLLNCIHLIFTMNLQFYF